MATPSARRAAIRPALRAARRPSAVLPVFEAESQSPATFPWTSRIVWRCGAPSPAEPFRLELVHLRAEGVALGGLPTAARNQALKRPLTPRPAPFRQMGAVQTLAAKQPAHLAGLRAALCLLQNPQSILRGELAPLRLGHDLRVRQAGRAWLAPALGASSRRSSTPRAGAPISCNVIDSLSADIGFHLHRPTVIPSGAGVSVRLAEREADHAAWLSVVSIGVPSLL